MTPTAGPPPRPPGGGGPGGRAHRALVVGTGLIGGSLGLALRARGWHVTGDDADADRARGRLRRRRARRGR